jgi:Protein of unknown function (DUF3631)
MTRPLLVLPSALAELTLQPRWVVWKWQKSKTGNLTKPPFQGRWPSRHASSTDAATWCDLKPCLQRYIEDQADGIGFALMGSSVAAIDIDDCRSATTGCLHPWASSVVARAAAMASYVEVTPSGEGLRVIGRSAGPPLHRKFNVPGAGSVSCELYRGAERYICITGQQLGDTQELGSIDALLDELWAELESGRQQTKGNAGGANGNASTGANGKHDLESLIKDGCGQDFGGDRSRATWFVIHALLKQGRSADEIVAVLLDPNNGISAHCRDQSGPENYARRQIEKAQAEAAAQGDVDAEIKRLAGLSALEYELRRKSAAEKLGVRAAILDRLVQAERPNDASEKQGRAIKLPEPQPWPECVAGDELLTAVAAAIGQHIIMPEHARTAAALWAAHTYMLDCFAVTPRLAIRSPVKRCGKTTLQDVLGRLIFRPLLTANITAAAIFRVVEAYRPALLVDEADTFVGEDNGDLRGVLNSGHRRGGTVVRTVGDDHEPRAFSTFSPCCIALIGKLPDTLQDRSIVLDLKRRLPSEEIVPFRDDRAGHLDELARKLARWSQDNSAAIAAADPQLPSGIYNREADNWRPLLAIADVAGGTWPELTRGAALRLQEGTQDDGDIRSRLLADIKAVFAEQEADQAGQRDAFAAQQNAQIASADLVEALVAIEGAPWAEFGRSGKPLTQNRLARLLKPFGIAPGNIWAGGKVLKGYRREDFQEAFERYFPSSPVSQPLNRENGDEIRTSATSATARSGNELADAKREKPSNDGHSSGLADAKGGNGKNAQEEPAMGAAGLDSFPLVCEHCGAPEQAGYPVQECWIDGDRFWLHRPCQEAWLDGPSGREPGEDG